MATTLERPASGEAAPAGVPRRRWQDSPWVMLAPISAVLLLVSPTRSSRSSG